MASVHRPPVPALRGLVASVWAHDPPPPAARSLAVREHVLPTGATHIALRIGGPPLLIFDQASDPSGRHFGHAVVGGARTAYHVRDVSLPSISVGAMLRPGAASVLLGVPESALAGHHTPLECLLNTGEVDELLSRLRACTGASIRLALFEQWLVGRARSRQPALHPALATVFFRPGNHDRRVAEMVYESGMSHRHCIALFRQATGLAPRQWLRLQRFAHALELAADSSRGWAEIAAAAGFADQAHLANTFSAMTGFTPSAWRRRADPSAPRHVPASNERR
ncbi:MAG: AraC family transcriptional regulator [Burkholderiaceae bacterium]